MTPSFSLHRIELNTRSVRIIFISFTLLLNKTGQSTNLDTVLGKLELIGGIKWYRTSNQGLNWMDSNIRERCNYTGNQSTHDNSAENVEAIASCTAIHARNMRLTRPPNKQLLRFTNVPLVTPNNWLINAQNIYGVLSCGVLSWVAVAHLWIQFDCFLSVCNSISLPDLWKLTILSVTSIIMQVSKVTHCLIFIPHQND